MSKESVRLSIDSDLLKKVIGSKTTWAAIAEKYGVTRQAVSNWLSEALIPPRALVEIVKELDLSPELVDEILSPQKQKEKTKKRKVITIEVSIR